MDEKATIEIHDQGPEIRVTGKPFVDVTVEILNDGTPDRALLARITLMSPIGFVAEHKLTGKGAHELGANIRTSMPVFMDQLCREMTGQLLPHGS